MTLGNTHLSIVPLNFPMILVPTLESPLLLLLRWHSNLFSHLLNLNYEIYLSHGYPLPSTWRIYCARFAAIRFIDSHWLIYTIQYYDVFIVFRFFLYIYHSLLSIDMIYLQFYHVFIVYSTSNIVSFVHMHTLYIYLLILSSIFFFWGL